MTEATPSPSQIRVRVNRPSQWFFNKYKNVAFGLCHLELNSFNHNFSWFSLKAKLQHGSTIYYANHIQRDRKHCWELSIGEWTIKNRVTNVVTLQTLTDSDERLTLETSAFESITLSTRSDKTKLSRYTSHRRSTTVSLGTYPSLHDCLP